MIGSHNDHDVSLKLSEYIIMLQGVYKYPNVCKTSQHMRKHPLLSYFFYITLILIAVTKNKIVTKEPCPPLLNFFLNLKLSFLGSVICFFFLNFIP